MKVVIRGKKVVASVGIKAVGKIAALNYEHQKAMLALWSQQSLMLVANM